MRMNNEGVLVDHMWTFERWVLCVFIASSVCRVLPRTMVGMLSLGYNQKLVQGGYSLYCFFSVACTGSDGWAAGLTVT